MGKNEIEMALVPRMKAGGEKESFLLIPPIHTPMANY